MTQHRFRNDLRLIYGDQCAAVIEGVRCIRTDRLQAHHGKNGEPNLLLCPKHHRAVDPYAR